MAIDKVTPSRRLTLNAPLRPPLPREIVERRIGAQQMEVCKALSLARLIEAEASREDLTDIEMSVGVLVDLLNSVTTKLDSVVLFASEAQEAR